MKIDVNLPIRITGKVHVQKFSKNMELIQELRFPNVVLAVGWENMKATFPGGRLYPEYLYLGTGTTKPKTNDLGLQNISPTLPGKYRFSVSLGGVNTSSERYSSCTLRFDYAEGEAVGTWTELGLGYNTTYITPFNRALFKDETSTPIAITVLADEYLRVFFTLNMHLPLSIPAQNFWFNDVQGSVSFAYGSAVNNGSYNFWYAWPVSFTYLRNGSRQQTTYLSLVTDTGNLSRSWTYAKNTVGDQQTFGEMRWNTGSSNTPAIQGNINIDNTSLGRGTSHDRLVCLNTEKMSGSFSMTVSKGCASIEDGLVTSATSNTITDSAKTWVVDEFAGYRLLITSGTGAGQQRTITANTADTLTVGTVWDTNPDATSEYEVCANG